MLNRTSRGGRWRLPCVLALLSTSLAPAKSFAAQAPQRTGPLKITLADALMLARQNGAPVLGANLAVISAKEDRLQAKAAMLPSLNGFNQFIYTEGNGTPSGVFVANDGVHVYNEQLQLHQELLWLARRGEVRRAEAAQASARARVEVAARGLYGTVIQSYYALVVAQRKLVNARISLQEADQFLDISQKQERGGEVAHADVIKAQLQQQQRQRYVQDAELAIDKARIALAVLIFPVYREDFTVEDDLETAMPIDGLPGILQQATANSADMKAAEASLREAGLGITVARYAYIPSFALDFYYGINANQFAARTDYATQATGGTLPNFEVTGRQNLGYSGQVTLNVPIWNWGATRSKVRQAYLRQQQAQVDVNQTERQLQANVESFYREAQVAQAQLDSVRNSQQLAAESLRLTVLRYQAGEATALEVVDAQSTLNLARNALEDGLLRYRTAIANIQTLTGAF